MTLDGEEENLVPTQLPLVLQPPSKGRSNLLVGASFLEASRLRFQSDLLSWILPVRSFRFLFFASGFHVRVVNSQRAALEEFVINEKAKKKSRRI